MKDFEEHIDEIVADFYELKGGWINFKIEFGGVTYEECFSYVFDPVLDFRNWLEAICTNVQQTSFTFNPEGNYIKFEIYTSDLGIDKFVIREAHDGGKTFVDTYVNRIQVVKALYESFMKLIQSDESDQKEWFRGVNLFEFKSNFIENLLMNGKC